MTDDEFALRYEQHQALIAESQALRAECRILCSYAMELRMQILAERARLMEVRCVLNEQRIRLTEVLRHGQ